MTQFSKLERAEHRRKIGKAGKSVKYSANGIYIGALTKIRGSAFNKNCNVCIDFQLQQ